MKKILFIDDDNRGVIENICSEGQSHFDFDVLKSIDNIFKAITSNNYDGIILDIMMPIPESWNDDMRQASESGIKTGQVLFYEIREKYPTLPILIYSALNHDIKNDKFTYSLRKPELTDKVIQKLSKLLSP